MFTPVVSLKLKIVVFVLILAIIVCWVILIGFLCGNLPTNSFNREFGWF